MSQLIRDFTPFGDRYDHDKKFTAATGWAQVDTYQDASYFGVWTNPTSFEIFTFCEGDRTLERCADAEDYKNSLRTCLEFYDNRDRPTKIDAVFEPELAGKFTELGFADRIH